MNILIVSATQFEVKPLLDFLEITHPVNGLNKSVKCISNLSVSVLITGIGMVNTAFMLGKSNLEEYALVLNVGVCGAFDKTLALGQLTHVTSDMLSELGAEDGDDFLTYDKLNLSGDYAFTHKLQNDYSALKDLKQVKGITVNTVHGNDLSIQKVKTLFNPCVESMEGAAFFACLSTTSTDFAQVRAISNYVEKRDKEKWNMSLAINNLNIFLIDFINNYS